MANTISTYTNRRSYFQSTLQKILRRSLIAEKICMVDYENKKYIDNPYTSQVTTTQQTLTGTYSVATFSTVDDTLTVTDEFVSAEQIYAFEAKMSNFNLATDRLDEQAFSMKAAIDKWVLNNLCEDATGAYTTPAGGFSASNIPVIFSECIGAVSGYDDVMRGMYMVVENTDVPGIIQGGAAGGFNFADSVLNNGMFTDYMGVRIYVTRTGTFVDATLGTTTVTNSGHRVFGINKCASVLIPGNVDYEELLVTTKTGKEVRTVGHAGFKLWYTKTGLTVDITLA